MTNRLKAMDKENEIESDWKFARLIGLFDHIYNLHNCDHNCGSLLCTAHSRRILGVPKKTSH